MKLYQPDEPTIGNALKSSITQLVTGWMKRRAPEESGIITLTQRRIYILPSGYGLFFCLALVLMLLGAINYNLSLGFILVFLLASMGMVSILHAFRNLSGLRLQPGRVSPVFAGETAHFSLLLTSNNQLTRHSIAVKREDTPSYVDVPPTGSTIQLAVPAIKRGELKLGRITIFTRYPIGLFHAWSYVTPAMTCLVYPQPEVDTPPLPDVLAEQGDGGRQAAGNDDFSGLRPYQEGDSPRRIAWRASARSDGPLLTKQFSGMAAADMMLTWNELPNNLGIEQRLSRLTRWILDAESSGHRYGLTMPGIQFLPLRGEEHLHRCLSALALFGEDLRAG